MRDATCVDEEHQQPQEDQKRHVSRVKRDTTNRYGKSKNGDLLM